LAKDMEKMRYRSLVMNKKTADECLRFFNTAFGQFGNDHYKTFFSCSVPSTMNMILSEVSKNENYTSSDVRP
jgi:hypothetical protein